MASVCVAMVAVEHAAFTYDQLYSYLVPDSLRNLVQRGVREPVLEAEDFEIIRYMTDAAFCSRYDVVRCLLPPGLSVEAKTTYRLSPSFDKGMLPRMAPEEQQLLRLLLAAPSQREVDMLFSGSGSTARRTRAATGQRKPRAAICRPSDRPGPQPRAARGIHSRGRPACPAEAACGR